MSIDNKNLTNVQPFVQVVKQCTPDVLEKLYKRVARACKLSELQQKSLLGLFGSSSELLSMTAWPEIGVTLWAFPPSQDAWAAMTKLLIKTLRPRVYDSAETRSGQQEIFMVVPLKPLLISAVAFEQWMQTFAENVGMSADCVCFGEYFGNQMISSMQRISKGRKLSSNFPCQYHRDFSLLFAKLSEKRQVEERVLNCTGVEFSPENFINATLECRRLGKKLQNSQDAIAQLSKNRTEMMRIVNALWRTNTINEETKKNMIQLLSAGVPARATTETVGAVSTFSILQRADVSGRAAAWNNMITEFELEVPRLIDVVSSDRQAPIHVQ